MYSTVAVVVDTVHNHSGTSSAQKN